MAKFIYKHRRGTASQWEEINKKIQDGEIGIEYNEDRTNAKLLLGNKEGNAVIPFTSSSKIITISLLPGSWMGENSPYSQVVIIDNISSTSRVDLHPDIDTLTYLQDSEISLVTENNNGTLTVYALNYKPDKELAIQATVTEAIA